MWKTVHIFRPGRLGFYGYWYEKWQKCLTVKNKERALERTSNLSSFLTFAQLANGSMKRVWLALNCFVVLLWHLSILRFFWAMCSLCSIKWNWNSLSAVFAFDFYLFCVVFIEAKMCPNDIWYNLLGFNCWLCVCVHVTSFILNERRLTLVGQAVLQYTGTAWCVFF